MTTIVIIPAVRAAATASRARALRASPALADMRDPFGLAVELTRSPAADERSIRPLVSGARLTLGVTLGLSDLDLASEARARSMTLERLYARSVSFELERRSATGRRVLATARGSGTAARGVLRTRLEPEDVVEVLAAVDGRGDITVRALVERGAGEGLGAEELVCPLSSLIAGLHRSVVLLAPDRGCAQVVVAPPRERAVPSTPQLVLGHDVHLPLPTAPVLPLPVVVTGDEPFWLDRSKTRRFVPPVWTVTQPTSAATPQSSPFALNVRTLAPLVGTGRAIIEATLRITLDASAPGGAPGELVAMRDLTALLEVPYRVAGDPSTRVQRFAGSVVVDAHRVTLTFELLDDWVRLVYGSLSVAGFFDRPVRVRIGYGFSAYVPVASLHGAPLLATKDATTPIAVERGGGREQPMLSTDGVLHVRSTPVAFVAARDAVPTFDRPRPATPLGLAAHPGLHLPATLTQVAYATRTIVREADVDVVFPCGTYGALYVEETSSGEHVIGCRDAFRLGETEDRLYEELFVLAAPRFRVWRSLREPRRFLVLPAAYRVERYAPTAPPDQRYRPRLVIYALLGGSPENSSYWVTGTLVPDLTVAERMTLLGQLAAYVRDGQPLLQFPTDPAVSAQLAVRWVLPEGIATPEVACVGDALEVGISTDLFNGVVLRALVETAGVRGSATFTLPDRVELRAEVVLDAAVIGPRDGGPVDLKRDGAVVVLDNCVLQAVDVHTLVVRTGSNVQRVAVDRTLAPGETARIAAPGDAGSTMWIEHEPTAPGPLDEIGVFEEDVTTNLVFVEQVRFSNHGILKLRVFARIAGSSTQLVADIPELGTANLPLVLPLTKYLDGQVVDLQVVVVGSDGTERSGDWFAWNLARNGSVVSITAALIP